MVKLQTILNFIRLNRQMFIFKFHFFYFQAGIGPSQTAMPVYAQTLGFSSFVTGTVYTILPIFGLVIKPALGAITDRYKLHKAVMLSSEFIIMVSYFCVQFIPSGFTPPIVNQTQSLNMFCNANNPVSFCNGLSSPYMLTHLIEDDRRCQSKCDIDPQAWTSLCQKFEVDELCYKFYNSTSAHGKDKICVKVNVLQPKQRSSMCSEIEKNINSCKIRCRDVKEDSTNDDDDDDQQFQDDSITFSQYQFYIFVLLMVGSFCGTAVTTTLADTICIAAVDDPHLYGKQRLWGSLGYGVLSVVSGLIVDAISGDGPKNYLPAFYLTLAVLTFDMVVSYFYINVEIPQKTESIVGDVWKMLLNVRVIVFLIWCAAMGISLGLTWTFLYWLLEDLAKTTGPDAVSSIKTIEGLTNGVQTFLGETPAFFFAGWVITKLGHGHTMTVILFTIAVRFTAYGFLSNPWYGLFIEPLQLYYGLFYSVMTSYANLVAPPGTEATVQTLMCAVCEGIGVAIGSFLGGLFYDSYGGNMCFRIFGISFLVMAILNEAFEFLWRRPGPKKQEQPT